ncbi:MAG: helix-turn-helix domain-containing protein [Gemmatimonadota bacterium]|nr:helix-turn-helix domain-containing protein [Gemmatimonadota bacterium]
MRRYIEAGVSKAATARAVGISRRTLYNWIEAGELERDPHDMTVKYGPRPPRPSKLDAWKAGIDARLREFPQLAAARLFREIRADGYPGGYGQVKRYVKRVRREILNGAESS